MTLVILRVFACTLVIPLIGMGFLLFAVMFTGSFTPAPDLEMFVSGFVGLAGLSVIWAMISGAILLDGQMRFQGSDKVLPHPARNLLLPPLACITAFSGLTVLVWLPSNLLNDITRTYPWPLVWGLTGTGAFFLFRWVEKTYPASPRAKRPDDDF